MAGIESAERRKVLVTGANGTTPLLITAGLVDLGSDPIGLIRGSNRTVALEGGQKRKILRGGEEKRVSIFKMKCKD